MPDLLPFYPCYGVHLEEKSDGIPEVLDDRPSDFLLFVSSLVNQEEFRHEPFCSLRALLPEIGEFIDVHGGV